MAGPQIPRFYRGQRLGATHLNRIVNKVNAMETQGAGSAVGVRPVAYQLVDLTIKALNNGTPAFGGNQYLECIPFGMSTSDPSAPEYYVFLPFLYWLTADPARGITFTYTSINQRTASDGGTNPDETQFLEFPLSIGETISVWTRPDGLLQMVPDGRYWAVDS